MPVRVARESDVAQIHRLIVDLATYERAADQVRSTPDQLREALFGPQPAAYALVAEVAGQVVGFALYFRSFSTWEGVHGIYLEDLYVAPEHRGAGLGKALLAALAAIARRSGGTPGWSGPCSTGTSRRSSSTARLGAVPMEEWTVFRLAGPALIRSPERRPGLGVRRPRMRLLPGHEGADAVSTGR